MLITGIVKEGNKLGREFGYRTANTFNTSDILGVFLSKTIIGDKIYNSVSNLSKSRIETHILEFDKDIYGEEITITLISKLRDKIVIRNREESINQLNKDINLAKDELSKL
jgi:riboflavin kinase/FMN adenylyltransferase